MDRAGHRDRRTPAATPLLDAAPALRRLRGPARRRTVIVATAALLLVAVAGGAQAQIGTNRRDAFAGSADQLRATWARDLADGVPDSLLTPLRAQLDAEGVPSWLSPVWWFGSRQDVIARLSAMTATVWDQAVAGARVGVQRVVADAEDFVTQAGHDAPSMLVTAIAGWQADLQRVATPAALDSLATQASATLASAEASVAAARAAAQAAAQAAVDAAGGAPALLAAVAGLDTTAQADNLDSSPMDALADQLRRQPADGATASQLLAAIQDFRSLVAMNDAMPEQLRQLTYEVSQAVVEGTPGSQAFAAAAQGLPAAFTAARTHAQMTAVQQAHDSLKAQVEAELAADTCGHPEPGGRAIRISLSRQELVAYQDGCVVRATPVTTGRPQLPTPAGSFRVFFKTSPFTMVSPWPPGSPFWYPTTPVTWVLEFAGGGYFLHDADWESPSAYGPGSENNLDAASHGCIHIPTPFMQWLYAWTPVGTPVQITA